MRTKHWYVSYEPDEHLLTPKLGPNHHDEPMRVKSTNTFKQQAGRKKAQAANILYCIPQECAPPGTQALALKHQDGLACHGLGVRSDKPSRHIQMT